MFKLNKIWCLAAFLILSFAIVSNWHSQPITSRDEPAFVPASVTTIGYSNSPGWWLWEIAIRKDMFANHGLNNIEFRWYDSYSQSIEDLASGYIDGNCQSLNDTISHADRAINGEVIVLVNDNSVGNDKIVVNNDITSIKDLKNKQVGIEEGLVEDYLLTLALSKEGMQRKDIDIIDVETGAATEAFAAGAIDGVGAFPPYWKKALERTDAREIVSSKDFPGKFLDLLVVNRKIAEQQSELVDGLVATWFDVIAFTQQHPQEAEQIVAERAGISIADVRLFKQGTKILSIEDNIRAFENDAERSPSNNLFLAAREIADFSVRQLQSIERTPNINKLINGEFIERYRKNIQYSLKDF